MSKIIAIKNEENMYVSELDIDENELIFSNDLIDVIDFKNLENAEKFIDKYIDLNDGFKYKIVRIELCNSSVTDETLLKKLN